MAFRTQLNILDNRLVQTKPLIKELKDTLDPDTISETKSLLDLDFTFISTNEETEFIFDTFSFKVDKFNFEPITSWNYKNTFKLGPHYFEKDGKIIGVEIDFFVEDIIQVSPNEFKGNCITDEYIEYSATTLEISEEIDIPRESVTITKYEITAETILAEDNKIELNFGGNHMSAINGGFTIINGVKDGEDSTIRIDNNGAWEFFPGIKIPKYNSLNTESGFLSWDNDNLYIKTDLGVKKVKLENI